MVGGATDRYFMYTAVLRLLNSSFRWGVGLEWVAVMGPGTKS